MPTAPPVYADHVPGGGDKPIFREPLKLDHVKPKVRLSIGFIDTSCFL
jgi:hypothetical protein